MANESGNGGSPCTPEDSIDDDRNYRGLQRIRHERPVPVGRSISICAGC